MFDVFKCFVYEMTYLFNLGLCPLNLSYILHYEISRDGTHVATRLCNDSTVLETLNCTRNYTWEKLTSCPAIYTESELGKLL